MMVYDDVISVTPTFYQYINRFVKEIEYPSLFDYQYMREYIGFKCKTILIGIREDRKISKFLKNFALSREYQPAQLAVPGQKCHSLLRRFRWLYSFVLL